MRRAGDSHGQRGSHIEPGIRHTFRATHDLFECGVADTHRLCTRSSSGITEPGTSSLRITHTLSCACARGWFENRDRRCQGKVPAERKFCHSAEDRTSRVPSSRVEVHRKDAVDAEFLVVGQERRDKVNAVPRCRRAKNYEFAHPRRRHCCTAIEIAVTTPIDGTIGQVNYYGQSDDELCEVVRDLRLSRDRS